MLVGLIAFWLLPDFPRSGGKTWLSEQEQRFAEHRIAISANNEIDEVGGVKESLKDAVCDPKVWALVFVQVCILSSQTWTYFFPTIVKTLGYGKIDSLLLTAPVYVFGFFHVPGQRIRGGQDWPPGNSHHVATRGRHYWQRHGDLHSFHAGPIHRHVSHVLWILLSIQRA